MDLLRKEKMQEQSLEDLKKLQDHKSSGKNRYHWQLYNYIIFTCRDMVDWIYSGSTSSAAPVCEDYLLGKKKPVLFESKGTTSAEPSLGISENKGISVRDAEAKAREDPLFLIKKSEQRKNNRGKPSHRAAPSNGRR